MKKQRACMDDADVQQAIREADLLMWRLAKEADKIKLEEGKQNGLQTKKRSVVRH